MDVMTKLTALPRFRAELALFAAIAIGNATTRDLSIKILITLVESVNP